MKSLDPLQSPALQKSGVSHSMKLLSTTSANSVTCAAGNEVMVATFGYGEPAQTE